MFKKARPKTKPSLLTIAMRANVKAHSESAVEQKSRNKPIWNTLRGHRKWIGGSSDYQDAVTSIERDVDALVSEENSNHQPKAYAGREDSQAAGAPRTISGAAWRWRWRIVATTLLGAIAGVMIAFAAPQFFIAENDSLTQLPSSEPIVENQVEPKSSTLPTATTALGGQLAQLKAAVENAERQAEAFVAANNQEGDALDRLGQLELEIEAARALYEAALLQTGNTSSAESLVPSNAMAKSVAEPPLNAWFMSRNVMAASGAIVGFMIGLGAAIIAGLPESAHANKNSPARPLPKGRIDTVMRRENNGEGLAVQPQPVSYLHPTFQAYNPAPMQRSVYDQPEQHHDAFGLSIEEELEMEEMRASVREIREVLDHLKQTRSTRQRYG